MSVGHNSAVRGTFADFKTVKTRGVCQLIIEVPIEAADNALSLLGGVPQAKAEQWVGIAPVTAPDAEQERPKGGERAKRAGILCNDLAFQNFLWKINPDGWNGVSIASGQDASFVAAFLVRSRCKVNSRAELDHHEEAGLIFDSMVDDFYRSQHGETDADLMEQRR